MLFLSVFLGVFFGILCAELVLALWCRRSAKPAGTNIHFVTEVQRLQMEQDERRKTKDIPRRRK